MEDYYQLLDLQPTATPDEIREQFRFLCHAYHPDKFPAGKYRQQAEEHFKRINVAYQTLSDPTARATYDQRRVRTATTSTTAQRPRRTARGANKEPAKPGDKCIVCGKPAIGGTSCCSAPYCRECVQDSLRVASKGRLKFECMSCFTQIDVGYIMDAEDIEPGEDCEICGNRAIGSTPCCEEVRCWNCMAENVIVTRAGHVRFECASCEEITEVGAALKPFA